MDLKKHIKKGLNDKMYNAVTDFIRESPHIAIYYKDQQITYSELYEKVCRYSNELLNRFKEGDEFIIKMSDRPEYFYLFWGAVKSGIIPHLLNPASSTQPKNLHVFDDDNIMELDEYSNNSTDNAPADTIEKDLCFYLYTSGTSGFQQAVPHRHQDLTAVASSYAKKTLNIISYDVVFSAAKLFFAYGMGNSMTFPLYVGAATILMSEPSTAKSTLDTIEKYQPTIYFGVPTIYNYQLKAKKRDLSCLRLCVSAGESLPGKIKQQWEDQHGTIILDGIGTTEALHIFISNFSWDHENDCTGRIVPGYEAKLLKDPLDGDSLNEDCILEECKDGEIGSLYIKGDSIAEDWLKTGDEFIRRGVKYYYQGRTNDMIKVGGVWISPVIMEKKIIEIDEVTEVAVVQHLDNNTGLRFPKAYVVSDTDNQLKLKNVIKRKCMDELPTNYFPKTVQFVDSLPKTDTGKIKRATLRSIYASEQSE